mmetsp:Transcript_702/g.865  ORF Transcript_702/g.865 Transcript_702/m.865 type:complete len:80 (+) Transcript_702:1535-1774(+)
MCSKRLSHFKAVIKDAYVSVGFANVSMDDKATEGGRESDAPNSLHSFAVLSPLFRTVRYLTQHRRRCSRHPKWRKFVIA